MYEFNTLDSQPVSLYEEGPVDASVQNTVGSYVGADAVSTEGITDLYGIDFDDEDLIGEEEDNVKPVGA